MKSSMLKGLVKLIVLLLSFEELVEFSEVEELVVLLLFVVLVSEEVVLDSDVLELLLEVVELSSNRLFARYQLLVFLII